jgi:hypothetical protein
MNGAFSWGKAVYGKQNPTGMTAIPRHREQL